MTAASPDPGFDRPIALVGMMGAGKTTLGRALAERIGCPFADSDKAVEQEAGCTITDIFAREGEAGFREREHRALERLLASPPLVLSTGGGALLDPRNRELLRRRAFTIWLNASPATLARRIGASRDRPLLEGSDLEARLAQLLADRRLLYAEADLRIDTDDCNEAEVLNRLLAAIRR